MSETTPAAGSPTVVLVHGAFADCGHVIMISEPQAVTDGILDALDAAG